LRVLGDKGSYSEESIKDARDLYGVSKDWEKLVEEII
jgi:hypothetical protein